MKLIIDIPEEVYKSIQDNDYCGISNSDMYDAVKNGTPLRALKNEQTDGDLISRKAVLAIIDEHDYCGKLSGRTDFYKQLVEELPSAEKTTINPEKTTIKAE